MNSELSVKILIFSTLTIIISYWFLYVRPVELLIGNHIVATISKQGKPIWIEVGDSLRSVDLFNDSLIFTDSFSTKTSLHTKFKDYEPIETNYEDRYIENIYSIDGKSVIITSGFDTHDRVFVDSLNITVNKFVNNILSDKLSLDFNSLSLIVDNKYEKSMLTLQINDGYVVSYSFFYYD